MKILAIDIGNTRASMGCFDNDWLCWRSDIETLKLIDNLDQLAGLDAGLCVISRVSAQAEPAEIAIRRTLRCQIISVNAADAPLAIHYDRPEKLGHDRIANALGARCHSLTGAIVVDLGTATHFDIIDPDGAFLGGPILLGVESMLQALSHRIPHLPAITPNAAVQAVSQSTRDALNAGAVLGSAGAVEKVIQMISKQLPFNPKIILTGGNAPLISPYIVYDIWAPHLTLEGLSQYALLTLQREKNRISA